MAIPDFQTIMLPLLEYFSDKYEHSLSNVMTHLEDIFNLSEIEKEQKVPNGQQKIIYNRCSWAIFYLSRAELLENTKRGHYRLTDIGAILLSNPPKKITKKFLSEKYPLVSTIKSLSIQGTKNLQVTALETEQSPEETISSIYDSIQEKLSSELLALIFQNSPSFFEKLVIDLIVKMGYGGNRKEAGEAVGKNNDEGIDGVINEDRLGLDTIYIQAKRWKKENVVGRPEIQKFVGALAGKQASKGIFITTSSFSAEAKNYVTNIQQKVILIDGVDLTRYMLEYDIGVSLANAYIIKKVDTDYFEEL